MNTGLGKSANLPQENALMVTCGVTGTHKINTWNSIAAYIIKHALKQKIQRNKAIKSLAHAVAIIILFYFGPT